MQQSNIFKIEFKRFNIDCKNIFADDSSSLKKKFFEKFANNTMRIQNF